MDAPHASTTTSTTAAASGSAEPIARVVAVLEALTAYYEQLHDWMQRTDPARMHTLEHAMRVAREAHARFITLAARAAGAEREFELVHQWSELVDVLARVYAALDFAPSTNADMSTTNSVRLTDAFTRVAQIYRVYARDLASAQDEVVREAAQRVVQIAPEPAALQRYWRAWPRSVELYRACMAPYMHSTNAAHRTAAAVQVESDKSWVLGEGKLLGPYLAFASVARAELPESWVATVRRLDARSTARTPAALITADRMVVVVARVQPGNVVQQLPCGSVTAARASAVHQQTVSVSAGLVPHWSVRVHGTHATAKRWVMLEQLGSDAWRILVGGGGGSAACAGAASSAGLWQPADTTLARIVSQEFARPGAYQAELARAIELDERVAHMVTERAALHDTGLNVLRITDALLQCWRTLRGTARTRLDDEALDDLYEAQIAHELDDVTQRDALLFWVEWSRRDFRKTLEVRADREGRGDNERGDTGIGMATAGEWGDPAAPATVQRVRAVLHDTVSDLLKRNAGIFQELRDLDHRLTVVATATRRGVAERAAATRVTTSKKQTPARSL